jgi:DNA mismatch repair ATPase MutS
MSQLHDKEPRGLALPRAGRSDDEGQEDETLPPCSASVTLSFVTDGPRVCFAAYNDESREIWIEECYANGYEVETIVERVVEILQPTLILVSSKIVAKENLLKVLTALSATQEDSHGNEQEQAGRQRSIPYQALRSSSFDVRACKALILQRLVVKSITRQQQQHQGPLQRDSRRSFPLQQQTSHAHPSFAVSRYHALASVLDLESTVQVQALGSLLSYLSKVVFATAEGGHVVVKDIIRGNLSLYMNISSATLSALHIFAVERHPLLAAKGTGNSKEGFSLFSMLDQTKSRIGRQRLREWMLKPLVDVESIRQRQNGIELFLLIEFGDCFGTLRKLLERVGAVDKILTRMQKCATQSSDFSVLVRSLSTALHICDEIRQTVLWNLQNIPSPTEPVFRYIQFVEGLLQNCSSQELQPLLERLTAAVDESSTNDWQTVVIRPGYNEQLDLLRERYDQLPDVLRDVGFRLSLQFPYLRGIMDVVFLPQVGRTLASDDRDAFIYLNHILVTFDSLAFFCAS